MESTIDNSQEKINNESIMIENRLKLEEFRANTVTSDGKNEIFLFLNLNRNGLIKLLGSIKQHFNYYSNIREALDKIIKKLEDVILHLYNINNSPEEILCGCLIGLGKIFDLFIILFQYETNNSFLEHFFSTFTKFLKKLDKLSNSTKSTISKHYSHYFTKIYSILIEKKVEYIDQLRDSKTSVKIIKIILLLLDKIHPDSYTEEIKFSDLFNFLFTTKNNIFALSKDIFFDKILNLITKIFKKILSNSKIGLLPNNYEKDIVSITEILLCKMLEIGKFKDDLKNSIEYSQQIFYVNTLILCLKLVKIILLRFDKSDKLLTNDFIKEKITRVIIELSFWDNYSIVDYNCKLFELIWVRSTQVEIGMRSNFEKIIEYMFLRRYQTYYNFLGESEDSNIKLSVLEIITKYFNQFIENSDFLILCYLNYDFMKIRFNLVGEMFNSLQKYYSLNNPNFTHLKKLITLTYLVSFKKISSKCKDEEPVNMELIKTHQNLSENWQQIIKTINTEGFKKVYEKMRNLFNLKMLDKKAEIINESKEVQIDFQKVSKSLAVLMKYSYYVDINVLYETIADNHDFSNFILKEYVDSFNFTNMEILKAYEVYVSTFKLYGEPHNIYNFLMLFSKRYFEDNKNIGSTPYKSEDQVSTLAYSILMLNTDLHNPNLTKHMTSAEFVRNNLSTKLYDDFPVEIFNNIYKSISSDPLKVANSRINDYTKSEEIFEVLSSKTFYFSKNYDQEKSNIVNHIENFENEEKSYFTLLNFPLLNMCENFNLSQNSHKNLKTVYHLLWEELYYNFMSMPYRFYELKDENTLKVLENVCSISQSLNQKENVDKLIMTLHSIINSGNYDKRNIVQLYNLFFNISINFSKNFNSYLEIYYGAILDIIKHKVIIGNVGDLRHDYNALMNGIIEKTFSILDAKRHKRSNSGGILNYFFSSNTKPETEFSIEQYKGVLNKHLKISSNSELILQNNGTTEDFLVEISKILEIIKNQEEEFIFFVTLSASKILDYNSKSEFYYSLIFLNEILDSNLQEKEFIKIWQNLYNIFKSKMEFKHIFEKEENMFDLFYANHFLNEIMTRFLNVIEVEDYYQLLENYLDIENIEVLYYVMESNNRLILNLKNHSHRKIIDKIFECNINLIFKLIEHYSQQIITVKNNYVLQKLSNSMHFFKNLIECVKDLSILAPDSLNLIIKILQIFYENNLVQVFWNLLGNNTLMHDTVRILLDKMENILPKVNDEKWDLFVFILQFNLKSALIESEDIQRRFIEVVLLMFDKSKIPLVKFKEINTLFTNYINVFVNLKIKYEGYWADVFKIFYLIMSNNEELFNSQNDIENLWFLFVKKFLISFVDYNKKTQFTLNDVYKPELTKIFNFVILKVKNMSEKPTWWESCKNTARLYFPDIVKDV